MARNSSITVNRRGFVAGGAASVAATALVVPLVMQASTNLSVSGAAIKPGLLPAPGTPLGA